MPPRISLASLIGIVAVIALSLAGMVSTSRLWPMVAATVTLIVLLGALLASWLFSGIDRAFWVGFALFSWTYLILVNWDWVGGQFGHDLTAAISDAAEWLVPEGKAPPPSPSAPVPFGGAVPAPPAPANYVDYIELSRQRQVRIGNFVQISRMVFSLIFGVLGGFLGRALAERAERSTRAETPASPG
jgi:hypothetical protein